MLFFVLYASAWGFGALDGQNKTFEDFIMSIFIRFNTQN